MSRTRVESPSPATLRKRKQMEARKKEGRKVMLLTPTAETLRDLDTLKELTGGSKKSGAEMILRRGVKSAIEEARALLAQMAQPAREARIYQPYARFLNEPGVTFRVKDKVLRAADWLRIAEQISTFRARQIRQGWSKKRIDDFLTRAAREPESAEPAKK